MTQRPERLKAAGTVAGLHLAESRLSDPTADVYHRRSVRQCSAINRHNEQFLDHLIWRAPLRAKPATPPRSTLRSRRAMPAPLASTFVNGTC
jgi:hypothetical protein